MHLGRPLVFNEIGGNRNAVLRLSESEGEVVLKAAHDRPAGYVYIIDSVVMKHERVACRNRRGFQGNYRIPLRKNRVIFGAIQACHGGTPFSDNICFEFPARGTDGLLFFRRLNVNGIITHYRVKINPKSQKTGLQPLSEQPEGACTATVQAPFNKFTKEKAAVSVFPKGQAQGIPGRAKNRQRGNAAFSPGRPEPPVRKRRSSFREEPRYSSG